MYDTVCGRVGSRAPLILDEEYGRLHGACVPACVRGHYGKNTAAFYLFAYMKH